MGTYSVDGGHQTTRVPTVADGDNERRQRRATRDRNARGNLSAMAMDRHPDAWRGDRQALVDARLWRDELLDILGLTAKGPRP
jgi:hypothetical protein